MKITINVVKTGWPVASYGKKEIDCKGSGTESDPVIIEPSENLPDMFILEKSNLFIIVQNCYLSKSIISSCQNVRIEHCNLWSISIQYCSKIFVDKSKIRRTLSIWESNHIKVDNCTINRLKIYFSNSNIIKNCAINKLKVIAGSRNSFETNRIPEKYLKKIKKKSRYG